MKLHGYRWLPFTMLFLILPLMLLQNTDAELKNTNEIDGKGLISFEFPWHIEAKVEVNLTTNLINLAAKSISNLAKVAELTQMLAGIYVRTYDTKTIDEQELVSYFRWKLKEQQWEAPVKIKTDDESIEIHLLFDADTVYGIFIIVIPEGTEEIIFVNIVGKIAPEHVEDLLRNMSNFGAMDINIRDKLKTQAVSPRNTVQRELLAVKIDYPPKIDGILDDACWKIAPHADGFTDGYYKTPVEDDTVVKVIYTPEAIYVGWYLYDSQPSKIVAHQTKAEKQYWAVNEDWVSFSIDPLHTHKFANRKMFMTNPLGAKYVNIRTGDPAQGHWVDVWKVAAKIVEDGWVAEMEIPWQMLIYPQTTEPIRMGINFDRLQARTRTHSWWSNIGYPERYEDDGHWLHVLPPPKSSDLKGWVDTLETDEYNE